MDSPTYECSTPSQEVLLSLKDTNDRNGLCSTCYKIDFKGAFALSSSQVGQYGVAITETRKDIDPRCSLCSFVAAQLSLNSSSTSGSLEIAKLQYHFRALDSLWPLRLRRLKARISENPSTVVAVVRGPSIRRPHRTQLNEAVSSGLIVPAGQDSSLQQSNASPLIYRGRIVFDACANFTRIAIWIKECHESSPHYRCRSQPRQWDVVSRVIDCWTRQIVPLAQGLEYLALSYVWGQEAANTAIDGTPEVTDHMPWPAPQTIEDAMSVVRSLGQRYLWVDRFCIWKSDNKHLQIQNMDQIYRSALATIVAVDAISAESGLRGLSCPRRSQYRLRTDAGVLVSTLPHISYHLSLSTWGDSRVDVSGGYTISMLNLLHKGSGLLCV